MKNIINTWTGKVYAVTEQRAQEAQSKIDGMRETFLQFFRLELIEIFSDASRRMELTDEQLAMSPTVEEAIEAIFGDVA